MPRLVSAIGKFALFAFLIAVICSQSGAQANASSHTSSASRPDRDASRMQQQRVNTISEIDYEWSATSLLCERHRIILHANGTETLFTKLCRNAHPNDRDTFCQIKQGYVGKIEFNNLARLIQDNGFFSMKPRYETNADGTVTTDSLFQRLRVTARSGKAHEVVSYAGNGPFRLWTILTAIEGISAFSDWNSTSEQPTCPSWGNSTEARP
jgi:hypothetical protein